MSRHRKIKALDYDEEYDDYYGAFDDDDADIDGDAFEAQYLSSGIDLKTSNSNNNKIVSKPDETRLTIDDKLVDNESIVPQACTSSKSSPRLPSAGSISDDPSGRNTSQCYVEDHDRTLIESRFNSLTPDPTANSTANVKLGTKRVDCLTSDLTRIAIQHLDKHQWQLPLLEMDKKFRDKTYYRHYTDSYISSLRSKLGHFLADNQLISNPMKYHLQQELDNYSKYSKMFQLLTDYYQTLGSGFFSFATPSPDEEIVIGCRLGTKVKKPVPKQNQSSKCDDQQKTARFEYQGKLHNNQPSSSKTNKNNATTKAKPSESHNSVAHKKKDHQQDLTIQENFTSDQLNELSKKCRDSLNIDTKSTSKDAAKFSAIKTNSDGSKAQPPTKSKRNASVKESTVSRGSAPPAPKQLQTLIEKRHKTKQQLKRNAEPSAQDWDTFKKQAVQTTKEYNELLKSSRCRVNLVVVGHVDAGKSTLVGHLLYKLGQISGKQMHRFEVDSQRSGKASFKFAWAMDETEEERARGVTIDIALTQFETPHRDIVLLDAPGHVDFIPAVISGAAQADAALLVVDATRGEFETGFTSGGQTREHTFLVRSLGVKSLIVVVNKMDNVGWNWGRFKDITDQLIPFLKQVGFNTKDDVQFVVCSGLTGENLIERRIDKTLKQSSHPQLEGDGGNWNEVPSLVEAIDKIQPPERMVDKPTRICITDVFKGMSGGVFLGGKVISGKIESKQKLMLLPPDEGCEIKQVETRDGKLNKAFAGDIVTTVAIGIEMNKFYRGAMLCDPLIPCQVTNRFQARIIMFQNANTILIKGTPVEIHINGTFECGEVRRLISLLNKNTGELIKSKPRCLAKNSSAIIQLKLSRVVCCELYESNKDLGRFMMRSYGKTIAAGLITKIKSAKVEKSGTKLKSK